MNSIPELVSQYLDGELDDQDFDLLTELLRDEDGAADEFVINSYVHSQLIDLMSQRRVQSEAADDSISESDTAELRTLPAGRANEWTKTAPFSQSHLERRSAIRANRRNWLRSQAGLAAALMVAAGVTALAYWTLARPTIVAQLSQSAGCRWETQEGNLPAGSLLRAGQELRLAEGRALIEFTCGAEVVLEGPAVIRLASAEAADLSSGRITTRVPTQAIGFAISSPFAQFIDLGTEFTLKLNSDDGFELHVFEGLVEIQFADHESGLNQKPLRISELTSVRYDAKSGDIAAQPIDMSERMSP